MKKSVSLFVLSVGTAMAFVYLVGVGSIAQAGEGTVQAAAGSLKLNPELKRYFTIGKAKVREIPEARVPQQRVYDDLGLFAPLGTIEAPSDDGGDSPDPEVILDKIINMGKKIWTIIEANKPVVNVSTDTGSALPEGTRGWQDLGGWQAPISRLYQVSYENLYGMTVVDFTFRVLYFYGGNVNGRGRYLTNITLAPANLDVAWGYTFNAKGTIPAVMNAGTSHDPLAAAQLQMDWSVDTVLKHSQSTAAFYVRGDGLLQNVSDGN